MYSIEVLKDLIQGGTISKNLSLTGLCGGLSESAPLVMVYEISRERVVRTAEPSFFINLFLNGPLEKRTVT